MQKRRLWRYCKPMLMAGLIVLAASPVTFAVTSTSNSYQMTEGKFGSGGSLNSCSAQFCAQTSIGDISTTKGSTAGTSSASFQPTKGTDPQLQVIIDPGVSNLGILTTEATATKTSTIRIDNYLVGGYTVQLVGNPPKFGNHTLTAPAVPTASIPGKEQFAINLVANSTPNVGVDPTQVPTGQATFGVVDNNYKIANKFQYDSEAVVARSNTQSGRTDYTVTMVINIGNDTPAGHYTGDYAVVVTPAY